MEKTVEVYLDTFRMANPDSTVPNIVKKNSGWYSVLHGYSQRNVRLKDIELWTNTLRTRLIPIDLNSIQF